jgi:hypothetical protein
LTLTLGRGIGVALARLAAVQCASVERKALPTSSVVTCAWAESGTAMVRETTVSAASIEFVVRVEYGDM